MTDPAGEPIKATVEDYKKALALIALGKPVRYVGATGAMSFDQFGDVTTPFIGWGVDGNKFVQQQTMTRVEVAEIKKKTGS